MKQYTYIFSLIAIMFRLKKHFYNLPLTSLPRPPPFYPSMLAIGTFHMEHSHHLQVLFTLSKLKFVAHSTHLQQGLVPPLSRLTDTRPHGLFCMRYYRGGNELLVQLVQPQPARLKMGAMELSQGIGKFMRKSLIATLYRPYILMNLFPNRFPTYSQRLQNPFPVSHISLSCRKSAP